MSAEIFIEFKDSQWRTANASDLLGQLMALPTFVGMRSDGEIWLLGKEDREATNRWVYDVRVFVEAQPAILVEISAHPPSIEADLTKFFAWLRTRTTICIVDDDGEESGW